MKLFLPLLAFAVLLFAGCANETCAEEKGLIAMDDYIATYTEGTNLTVQTHESGLRYIILEPGGADKPDANADVVVNYQGRQTNDEIFDENDNIRFNLQRLIPGWQIGIPLIGAGGSIVLFVPSQLAYGPRGTGDICPNSNLVFDIDLISFTD